MRTLLFAVVSSSLCFASKSEIKHLIVTAVAHNAIVSERTGYVQQPGHSSTTCSGTGTTVGNTTQANANCQTTSTPSTVTPITTRTLDVTNRVMADGLVYTIVCRASWAGSNCGPLIDGDMFDAQLDGTTMWISARRGGNQGKAIRIKYKVLDIRPPQ